MKTTDRKRGGGARQQDRLDTTVCNDDDPADDNPADRSFSAPWNAGYRGLTDAEWQAIGENSI